MPRLGPGPFRLTPPRLLSVRRHPAQPPPLTEELRVAPARCEEAVTGESSDASQVAPAFFNVAITAVRTSTGSGASGRAVMSAQLASAVAIGNPRSASCVAAVESDVGFMTRARR